jgi:hypothetical protein
MDDDRGLGGIAGGAVDLLQCRDRGRDEDAVAGAEAEGVGEARLDDAVIGADIDDVGNAVLRRRLRRGKADEAGIATHHRGHAGLVILLDLGDGDVDL